MCVSQNVRLRLVPPKTTKLDPTVPRQHQSGILKCSNRIGPVIPMVAVWKPRGDGGAPSVDTIRHTILSAEAVHACACRGQPEGATNIIENKPVSRE